ncbi:hypothetical protein VP01_4453g2 [Puccinia sorghi]|uniref:Uncharacterized protein n=1 Tax=Puccinia sorghi TaxID=27349 RepID=A0A0L6URD5_9BASI|nr:hypothetical protein VP01_4453g2 [Puccinia sorghi]
MLILGYTLTKVCQYLLADLAHELATHMIPAYKLPASNLQLNSDFNYCLATSCVRNEHMIGFVGWMYACVILHNILAWLGNQWMEVSSEDNQSVSPSTPATPSLLVVWNSITPKVSSLLLDVVSRSYSFNHLTESCLS